MIRASGVVCAAILFLCVGALDSLAQGEQKLFIEQLEESVVFIRSAPDSSKKVRQGTGFLVACMMDSGSFRTTLVTARHVLDSIKGDSAQLYLRLNADSSRVKPHTFPIRQGGQPLYTTHPDDSVDLAIITVAIPRIFRVQYLPIELFADDSTYVRYHIHVGEKVMFFGYPLGVSSPTGYYPILRSGTIASYPLTPLLDQKIVYLDGEVFKGNSGGPVFIDRGSRTVQNVFDIFPGMVIGVVTQQIYSRNTGELVRLLGFVNSGFIRQLLSAHMCKQ